MQLRWTDAAANDLERIADCLLLHVSDRAQDLPNLRTRNRLAKRELHREL